MSKTKTLLTLGLGMIGGIVFALWRMNCPRRIQGEIYLSESAIHQILRELRG